MTMKILSSIIFLATVVLALLEPCFAHNQWPFYCNYYKHSLEWGKRQSGDQLLKEDSVVEAFKHLRASQKMVGFPEANQPRKHIITFVKVMDNYIDNEGGCPVIIMNDENDYVQIDLLSQVYYGMNFDYKIYGKPK